MLAVLAKHPHAHAEPEEAERKIYIIDVALKEIECPNGYKCHLKTREPLQLVLGIGPTVEAAWDDAARQVKNNV